MTPFSVEWVARKQHDGMLLRDFLRKEKQISKKALADIKFAGGFLFVNKKEVTVRAVLSEGDLVTVVFPCETPSPSLVKENLPLDIVYEDAHFLVVNKPPQMATIPSFEHPTGTLANGILHYYEQKKIPATFHAVNRLDKDTSGLLVVAKHRFAHDLMTKQQQEGKLKREYLAIVHEVISQDVGVINEPIGRKEGSIIEREVRPDGQKAITHFQVLKRFHDRTVVKIQLETGRTHQIRVHFSYMGHPLLGDDLYGGKRDQIERQALHSYKCTFFHPFFEREFSFTQDVPQDMKILI